MDGWVTGGWGGGDGGGSDGCIVVWLLNFNAPSTPQGYLRTNKHFVKSHIQNVYQGE